MPYNYPSLHESGTFIILPVSDLAKSGGGRAAFVPSSNPSPRKLRTGHEGPPQGLVLQFNTYRVNSPYFADAHSACVVSSTPTPSVPYSKACDKCCKSKPCTICQLGGALRQESCARGYRGHFDYITRFVPPGTIIIGAPELGGKEPNSCSAMQTLKHTLGASSTTVGQL
jgi:hypothetical protein